ncbi:MAG TPA: AAA family ATPase [Terriglobia bacterium]|nr:AAA family ATPase [Terriglobia bacterium]
MRPSVVVLCGPAGCGKSTFAAKYFRPTQVISSDQCRALVCDDERDQRFQEQAFALLDFILDLRLDLNRLCVVDSTAITQSARWSLLERSRRHGVPCVAVLFDVSLETCLAHDQARPRTVGPAIVERQFQLFQQVKAGISEEGFEQVIVLREEDLDNAQVEIAFRPVMDRAGASATAAHARPFERRSPRPATRLHGPRPAAGLASPAPAPEQSPSPADVTHPEPAAASNAPGAPGASRESAQAAMASVQPSGGDGTS